jgi:carbonic anhydrase/acetyltransferase-like protein (isoleucine patch superfamily)
MIVEFQGKRPRIDPTAFIAENAMVIGDVEIKSGANIWFGCIVRGDVNYIRIGANCNIQDACVLNVVLGHRVVVHGCRVGKGSLIGIGAIVLNGAEIGEESIIGAGSVVAPGTVIPPRTLALGIPAKVIRPLGDKDLSLIQGTGEEYLWLKELYKELPV